MSISSILKGVGGELEAGRVIWVFGTASFVISFIGLAIYARVAGQPFSPTEYGIGFSTGFGGSLAAGGFAIKQKDTGVATAVLTRDGTATPATEQGS